MLIITSEQIRACRSILRWTVDDLSKKTGISVSTIKRIEKTDGIPSCRIENIRRIRSIFEETGITQFPNSNTIKIKAGIE